MNLNTSTPDAVNAAAQTRFDGISHADVLTVLGAKHFATLRENNERSLEELFAGVTPEMFQTEEDIEWLEMPSVGKEVL